MKENFPFCLVAVLRFEGRFVNDQRDPGGATNHGITISTWSNWTGRHATVDDIRAVTVADVTPLYRSKYWDAIKGDELPSGLDFAVFDTAVNSGVTKAAKLLQEALGLKPDGIIGPVTVRAAQAADARRVASQILDARLAFLRGLGAWSSFGRGWARRIDQVRANVDLMA